MRIRFFALNTFLVSAGLALSSLAQNPASAPGCSTLNDTSTAKTWMFAVSGDSRNCGDVVMPAIAASAAQHGPKFYWHLGDFRWRVEIDEDMRCGNVVYHPRAKCLKVEARYLGDGAWDDFIEHQVSAFGEIPVFLGIGNHETILHHNRKDFKTRFDCWLDAPILRSQRAKDDPQKPEVQTWYHWVLGSVDFINLDNAGEFGNTNLSFGQDQVDWFKGVLQHDEADAGIKTLVVWVI